MTESTPTKQCRGPCERVLPATVQWFQPHNQTADGLMHKCRDCVTYAINRGLGKPVQPPGSTPAVDERPRITGADVHERLNPSANDRIRVDDVRLAFDAMRTRLAAAQHRTQLAERRAGDAEQQLRRLVAAVEPLVDLLQTDDETIASEPGWSRFRGNLDRAVHDAAKVLADLHPTPTLSRRPAAGAAA